MSAWAVTGAVACLVVGIAILGERRRQRRADLDKVGFMPWSFITVMAFLLAVIAFGLVLGGA